MVGELLNVEKVECDRKQIDITTCLSAHTEPMNGLDFLQNSDNAYEYPSVSFWVFLLSIRVLTFVLLVL